MHKSFLLVLCVAMLVFTTTAYAGDYDHFGPLPEDEGVITFNNPTNESYTAQAPSTPSTVTTVEGEVIPYKDQFTSEYFIASDGSVSRFNAQDVADEIFRLSNIERVNAGLGEVERRTDLDEIAMLRAKELVTTFDHYRPDGSFYTSIADEYGISYRYIGENAGRNGNGTAASMVNNWMNSDGHRANMLNDRHTGLGVGVYKQGQMVYCVQMFIYE